MDFGALNRKKKFHQMGDFYEDPLEPDMTRSQEIQLPNALGLTQSPILSQWHPGLIATGEGFSFL